jgi:general secretion pathway protein G
MGGTTMLERLAKLRETNKDQKGFTLIELLIVIIILGVLAAIVVFSVGGITDRGNTSACKANVSTINTAVEAFYAQTGNYPNADTDLTAGTHKFMEAPVPTGYITYNGVNTAPTVKLLTAC